MWRVLMPYQGPERSNFTDVKLTADRIVVGGAQQERQRQLLLELEARNLNILDGFLAAQRYIQGLPGGPNGLAGTPQSLEEAADSIARRRFIVAHCSPERALALAGCQWAAQETEQLVGPIMLFFQVCLACPA